MNINHNTFGPWSASNCAAVFARGEHGDNVPATPDEFDTPKRNQKALCFRPGSHISEKKGTSFIYRSYSKDIREFIESRKLEKEALLNTKYIVREQTVPASRIIDGELAEMISGPRRVGEGGRSGRRPGIHLTVL